MLTGPVLKDTAAMIKNSRQGDLRELMSELNKGEEKASEDGSESETDLLARSLESPTLQHTQSVNSIQFNQPTNQARCRRKEGRKEAVASVHSGGPLGLPLGPGLRQARGWLAGAALSPLSSLSSLSHAHVFAIPNQKSPITKYQCLPGNTTNHQILNANTENSLPSRLTLETFPCDMRNAIQQN